MLSRSTRFQRSAAEWVRRGALALISAGIGFILVSHSLAYMIRGNWPARAHALSPWDGRITASLSEKLSGPEASDADRKRADDLAQLALLQDPMALAAVATLGVNAQIRGDTIGARRIFAYAEMLSRRDFRTRIWAIEDAVARGDIADALRSYDIALRTSRIAPDLLFPLLASAIENPAVCKELIVILANKPAWTDQFIGFVSSNGPSGLATASLFEGLHGRGIALPEGSSAALIERLLGEGRVEDAWDFYAAIMSKVDRGTLRDPNFAVNPASPTPFDWRPIFGNGVSSTIQRNERGGIFDFAVPPNLGGPMLRQTQLLPPGEYTIEGHSVGVNQTDDALPYWTLTCGERRELGRVTVTNSAQSSGNFTGRFTVPEGCPVQQLLLVARPSQTFSGLTGQIDNVRLRSVRRGAD
jgi:hypothetical protein